MPRASPTYEEVCRWYGVEYTLPGESKKTYGYAYMMGPEGKRAWKHGKVAVAHAVLPRTDEVPVGDVKPIKGRYPNEVDKYAAAEYEKAKKVAAKADGVTPGAMFHVGVADGAAFYVVTHVTVRHGASHFREREN